MAWLNESQLLTKSSQKEEYGKQGKLGTAGCVKVDSEAVNLTSMLQPRNPTIGRTLREI